MKITREAVQEAITLTSGVLPRTTAIELAQVIGVPLHAMLKSIQANRKLFKLDAEKNIVGLDATGSVQTMNSTEVWAWYVKNRLQGKAERCLPLSDQSRLNGSVNSRVKWETNFGLVTATFATNEATGSDVHDRVSAVYSPEIAKRLVRLGTVSGAGQIPDRYLYGVMVTEAEIKDRRICGLSLYSPEWAMEEMLTEVDWIVIDTGPRPGAQWIPRDKLIEGDPIDGEGEGEGAAGGEGQPDDAAVLAQAAKAKAAAAAAPGSDKKINRRTKEQLDAERSRWNAELIALGASPADAVKCFNIEKFKEAEEFYKTTKASFTKVAVSPAVEAQTPQVPGQQELPGTAEARNAPPQPQTPLAVQPPVQQPAPVQPPVHPRMPTLADLESVPPPSVKDLKADIAAKAGMAPPANPGPAATPAAAVAQAPGIPLAPPMPPPIAPPAQPPPAGASASAEDLLNSLLKSTGQTG